ncbi:class I SAM-dependent methyltransferase [Ramlibacter sp.]|uniref:class I SAM-dependent methyltransferase n=1 Tax=Ramlibacter sp. TaxID=1917967 RepID=UPI002D2FF228|nr:class I SAM-dependent methyltransferase [Ramlibacter sp.]HYD76379.1 class I SAM-dependent methyltransferase [Ramlibacter sp.]
MNAKPVSDTFQQGAPYERYVGRWSRRVAPLFLDWLDQRPARRWLDVGCGTGALCGAILDRCAPASVTGVEPSEGFLQLARQNLGDRVELRPGNAAAIPLETGSVDVVVSGLVLNFVPDPAAGLAEMVRVLAGGGTVAAYVWDYAGKMELMQHFWAAATELDPGAARLDEGPRFPLCHPEALQSLFADAGLAEVAVQAIDIDTPFTSFDDYWQPFLGGQGPGPAYAMSLDEAARTRLRDRLRQRLPVAGDGSIPLAARAWAVRGRAGPQP